MQKLFPDFPTDLLTEDELESELLEVGDRVVLELQRNVIFGQFVETGSFIHRMDARVKIAATSVLIVASFLIDDFSASPSCCHSSSSLACLQDTPRVRTSGLADLPRVPRLYPRFPGALLRERRA